MNWHLVIRRKSRTRSVASGAPTWTAHPRLGVAFAGLTTKGVERETNEDSFGVYPDDPRVPSNRKGRLFIIADGMGGHTSGKEASETAVKIILGDYFSSPMKDNLENLVQAFRKANARIHEISQKRDAEQIMGTTCSALLIAEKTVQIVHVGDSRIYRICRGRIDQLTQDHTEVIDLVKSDLLSKEKAENYPRRYALNRALGVEPDVKVETRESIALESADCFVLCTDGLAMVAPDEIKDIVLANSARQAAEKLIELSQRLDGNDNVTVIVVKFTGDML